jgi:hypothetical protein
LGQKITYFFQKIHKKSLSKNHFEKSGSGSDPEMAQKSAPVKISSPAEHY